MPHRTKGEHCDGGALASRVRPRLQVVWGKRAQALPLSGPQSWPHCQLVDRTAILRGESFMRDSRL